MGISELHRCRIIDSPWPGVYCTYMDSARHYPRHWHTTFGLGVVEQGAQASASGRGSVRAYAGDLITTNPGEVHDGRPLGGASRRWRIVYFEPAAVASMFVTPGSQGAQGTELTQPVIQDRELGLRLRRLFACLESLRSDATTAGVMACEESLLRTCSLLFGRYASSGPPDPDCGDLRRVRDRLTDELLCPPSLSDLAIMVGVSKYQLLRRFERVYGVAPSTWLRVQRTERARSLIRDGVSLADAAASCGFADQSHMTRSFVRQLGFTPGAWRKAAALRRPVRLPLQ